jgi:hypothetical protein
MLGYARARGVRVAGAAAEALPFASGVFDCALIVTTICFMDDATAMLGEARRVLRPGGELVIGFVDRTGALGQHCLAHQAENVFYREARFYSADEVQRLLHDSGFAEPVWTQTLFQPLAEIHEIEAVRAGCGQGALVVVQVRRPGNHASRDEPPGANHGNDIRGRRPRAAVVNRRLSRNVLANRGETCPSINMAPSPKRSPIWPGAGSSPTSNTSTAH